MIKNHIRVSDQYRKNPLSIKPGGEEVTVYMTNGLVKTYDKIKSPKNYISNLKFKDDIVRIDINGTMAWDSKEGTKFWEE